MRKSITLFSNSWQNEVEQIESELGALLHESSELDLIYNGKGQRFLFGEGETAGLIAHDGKVQGRGRKRFPIYGLTPLLMVRSYELFRQFLGAPDGIFDFKEPGWGFDELVSYILFFRNPEKCRPLFIYALERCPDWTLTIAAEIRRVFADRVNYAPDYLIMSFQEAGMKTDCEIDDLVSRFFPAYAGSNALNRSKKLKIELTKRFSIKDNEVLSDEAINDYYGA